jgi:thiosulfate/3-mercaptopyruvate sulfurtransferase
MRKLAIKKGDTIVCYADTALFGACRSAWMFMVYGFGKVYILNGVFSKWKEEGRIIEKGQPTWMERTQGILIEAEDYEVDSKKVATMEEVLQKLNGEKENYFILDARETERFKEGHIPGAINIFSKEFLGTHQCFRSRKELLELFDNKGIDLTSPIYTHCKSGMSASILFFAACLVGSKNVKLYDGSWAEWSSLENTPKTKD